MSKNKSQLLSFTEYCFAHPTERFWQALRNWSEYNFIFGAKFNNTEDLEKVTNLKLVEDTFYKE